MPKLITTLCIVQKNSKILLGFKKKGFGMGRWNGFGGKVEKNETIEDAARREMKEECGIEVLNLEKLGVMDFEFQASGEKIEVNVFKTTKYSGGPVETEEMKPAWFDTENIPYDAMWPDDRFWTPFFLENKKFRGKFIFEEKNGEVKIFKKELFEVRSL